MCFLQCGYRLFNNRSGSYSIKKVIGRGSSAIVYLTEYTNADGICSERILKECYPYNLKLTRECDGAVLCPEEFREKFTEAKDLFVRSGQRQNELREKIYLRNEIPPILNAFENNNTIYLEVTPYSGRVFSENTQMTLLQRVKLCIAVAKLIRRYHSEGYLCLDLKPDNIFVLTNSAGEIVTDLVEYIDFDSIVKKGTLLFGQTLSYTEGWAAPEQLNPYSYNRIAETTDIYCLGELVFWSTFNRHSREEEHRSFSQYPFEDSKGVFPADLRPNSVRRAFDAFFCATLRSSPKNRCKTMSDAINLLKRIEAELEKEYRVFTPRIIPNTFFIGRETEISELSKALLTNNIVFVAGIAGIGKSELLKQYCIREQKNYDNIIFWTFEGSLGRMVALDALSYINDFYRFEEESDLQYAVRKLKRMRELLDGGENLIVIDNLDCPIEELPDSEIWNLIQGMPAKIVVGTRIQEALYTTIHIDPIRNDELVELFNEYAPVEDEAIDTVRELIDAVGGNTILVELLAKQLSASHRSLNEIMTTVCQEGVEHLSNEKIRLKKDGRITSESIVQHIEDLFALYEIPEQYLLQLSFLALMPVDGIPLMKFKKFFFIDQCDGINWLIQRGWIKEQGTSLEIIQVHPSISASVINFLKKQKDLLEQFFKGCSKSIHKRISTQISEKEHSVYADSIIYSIIKRYHIESRSAAILVQRYVDKSMRFGNTEEKLRQIEYSIHILEKLNTQKSYSAVLEYAYFLRVEMMRQKGVLGECANICKDHYAKAKTNKDYFLRILWSTMLGAINNTEELESVTTLDALKFYWGSVVCISKLENMAKNNKEHRAFTSLDYDYLGDSSAKCFEFAMTRVAICMESINLVDFYLSSAEPFSIKCLEYAVKYRAMVNHPGNIKADSNGFEYLIDKARVAFLKCEYKNARYYLDEITRAYRKYDREMDVTLYRVHRFLGNISLRIGPAEYSNAIVEFEQCLYIADKLKIVQTFSEQNELVYLYVICGKEKEAEALGTKLLQATNNMDLSARKTYYADSLTNMGFLYLKQKKYAEAFSLFSQAGDEYETAQASMARKCIGHARLDRLAADLCRHWKLFEYQKNLSSEANLLSSALKGYENTVGRSHPEAQMCIDRLKEMGIEDLT